MRQALQRLEAEGFVVTEPRRGAVVRLSGNAELAGSLAYAHIELGRAPILAALSDVLAA